MIRLFLEIHNRQVYVGGKEARRLDAFNLFVGTKEVVGKVSDDKRSAVHEDPLDLRINFCSFCRVHLDRRLGGQLVQFRIAIMALVPVRAAGIG